VCVCVCELKRRIEGVSAHFVRYSSYDVRSDPGFVLQVTRTRYQNSVLNKPSCFLERVATPAPWSDRDLVRVVVQMDPVSIYRLPDDFSVDEEFVLAVIEGLERPADLFEFS